MRFGGSSVRLAYVFTASTALDHEVFLHGNLPSGLCFGGVSDAAVNKDKKGKAVATMLYLVIFDHRQLINFGFIERYL